jgi:ribosomal 30S subunit maturation factor RimM
MGELAPWNDSGGKDTAMSMTWNPTTHDDYDDLKGFDVYSSDNEKLGTIKEVFHPRDEMPMARGRHYFHVEPGVFKKLFSDLDEVYVPERLIMTVDPTEDKVILEVPKAQLTNQDWSRPRELDTFRRS